MFKFFFSFFFQKYFGQLVEQERDGALAIIQVQIREKGLKKGDFSEEKGKPFTKKNEKLMAFDRKKKKKKFTVLHAGRRLGGPYVKC